VTEFQLLQIEQRARAFLDYKVGHVYECPCLECAPAWDALRLVRLVRSFEVMRRRFLDGLEVSESNEQTLYNMGGLKTLNWVLGLDKTLPVYPQGQEYYPPRSK